MPFIRDNFVDIGGQHRPSVNGSPETRPGSPMLWSYRTQDAPAVVDTSGYFNQVARSVRQGDFIFRSTVDGAGAIVSAGVHVVLTVTAAGVVNVSDTTAFTVTNTD
jgi:hypothetical protein